MPDIKHKFRFAVEPSSLFHALTEQTHVTQWWTADCGINPKIGSTAEFHWKDLQWKVVMRIDRLEPFKNVEWRCIESNMQGTNAWVDTILVFHIEADGPGCTLQFKQLGYKDSPCYEQCNPGWYFVLGTSLKEYLENGRGRPYQVDQLKTLP